MHQRWRQRYLRPTCFVLSFLLLLLIVPSRIFDTTTTQESQGGGQEEIVPWNIHGRLAAREQQHTYVCMYALHVCMYV